MALKELESAIMRELREVVKNRKLLTKHLMEWSSSEDAVEKGLEPGEIKVHLPGLGLWCAINKDHDKRTA